MYIGLSTKGKYAYTVKPKFRYEAIDWTLAYLLVTAKVIFNCCQKALTA